MEQWHLLSKRFNQMTARERIMAPLASIFVLSLLLYMFWLEPMLLEREKNQNQLAQIEQSTLQLSEQIERLELSLRRDPNDGVRKELAELKQNIDLQDEKLGELTLDLISPSQMLPVLQKLLEQTSDVKLLSLNSKPPEVMMQDPEKPELGMFKHSLELKLEASYFQVHKLLKAIESLPWRFYWQEFDYKVKKYPKAEIKIEVYTLSTSEDYIRV